MFTFTVSYQGEDTIQAAKLYHELRQVRSRSRYSEKLVQGHDFRITLDMHIKDLERMADEAAKEFAELVEQYGDEEAIQK